MDGGEKTDLSSLERSTLCIKATNNGDYPIMCLRCDICSLPFCPRYVKSYAKCQWWVDKLAKFTAVLTMMYFHQHAGIEEAAFQSCFVRPS